MAYSEIMRRIVRRLYKDGLTTKEMAEKYEISEQDIRTILDEEFKRSNPQQSVDNEKNSGVSSGQ